jgi:hypothetical protein
VCSVHLVSVVSDIVFVFVEMGEKLKKLRKRERLKKKMRRIIVIRYTYYYENKPFKRFLYQYYGCNKLSDFKRSCRLACKV